MTLLIIMNIFMTLAWRISDAFKEKALHFSLIGQMGYDEKSNNEVAYDGGGGCPCLSRINPVTSGKSLNPF